VLKLPRACELRYRVNSVHQPLRCLAEFSCKAGQFDRESRVERDCSVVATPSTCHLSRCSVVVLRCSRAVAPVVCTRCLHATDLIATNLGVCVATNRKRRTGFKNKPSTCKIEPRSFCERSRRQRWLRRSGVVQNAHQPHHWGRRSWNCPVVGVSVSPPVRAHCTWRHCRAPSEFRDTHRGIS
jgi:hypothetical protein